MIELRTGLPGAGKTLFALKDVREWAEKDGRQVYYFNIADLAIPGWLELEEEQARKWYELPARSIVVIDEAQRIFRPRHVGSNVPDWVAKLETHRHLGVDLVFITQHPGLLDANVRKLVGRHLHYVRAFGTGVAVRHEWAEVKGDVDKSRADSMQATLRHPREVYKWYKSAEVHTVKRRFPARLLLLVVVPVGLALAGWLFSSWMASRTNPAPASKGKPGTEAASPVLPAPVVAPGQEWHAAQAPRVPSLAFTAPVYDGAMPVQAAPFPAACISSSTRCSCYTDQGTRLDVADDLCRMIVDRGLFDPRGMVARASAAPSPDGSQTATPPASSAMLTGSPLQASPTRPGA